MQAPNYPVRGARDLRYAGSPATGGEEVCEGEAEAGEDILAVKHTIHRNWPGVEGAAPRHFALYCRCA